MLSCKWVFVYMNIFNALRVYATKWQVSNKRSFTAEEIEAVASATIKESEYGASVCFIMKSGGQTYIPLDQNSSGNVGDLVDLSKATLITLSREGDDDIFRVLV